MWPSRALTSLASLLAVAVIASACSDQQPVAPESEPQLIADASTPLDDAGNPIKETFVDSGGSHLEINPDPPPDGTILSGIYDWISTGTTRPDNQYSLRLQDDGGVHINFHFQTTDHLTIDLHWRYHDGNELAYIFNNLNSTSAGFRAFTNGIAGNGLYFRNVFGGSDIDLSDLNVQDGGTYHIRLVLDANAETYTVYIDGTKVGETFYDGSGFTSHDFFRVMGRRTGSSTQIEYDRYVWVDEAIHRFETPISSEILHYELEDGQGEVIRNGVFNEPRRPSETGEPAELRWPLDPTSVRSTVSQPFGAKNAIGTGKYHAGLDISWRRQSGPSAGSPVPRIVRAAADGWVAKIFEIQPELKNSDETDEDANIDNHCMGNVVIIDHGVDGLSAGRYSLYAHLASIRDEVRERLTESGEGRWIEAGTPLGRMGNTGFNPDARKESCGPLAEDRNGKDRVHLHWEIKDSPILNNPQPDPIDSSRPWWGYTPAHPTESGYHDPIQLLHPTISGRPTDGEVVASSRSSEGVQLFAGPGGADSNYEPYPTWKKLADGTKLRILAIRQGRTVEPECRRGWGRVARADREEFQRQEDHLEAIGTLWACRDLLSR